MRIGYDKKIVLKVKERTELIKLIKNSSYSNDTLRSLLEKIKFSAQEIRENTCSHEWKDTHSGYCRDCVKCGKKE